MPAPIKLSKGGSSKKAPWAAPQKPASALPELDLTDPMFLDYPAEFSRYRIIAPLANDKIMVGHVFGEKITARRVLLNCDELQNALATLDYCLPQIVAREEFQEPVEALKEDGVR